MGTFKTFIFPVSSYYDFKLVSNAPSDSVLFLSSFSRCRLWYVCNTDAFLHLYRYHRKTLFNCRSYYFCFQHHFCVLYEPIFPEKATSPSYTRSRFLSMDFIINMLFRLYLLSTGYCSVFSATMILILSTLPPSILFSEFIV